MQLTHAYIRIEDFKNIHSAADTKLIAAGVRNDGSIIVAQRSAAGRVISWIKDHLGQRDEAAEALAQIFCRQLSALGASGTEALNVSGININGRVIKLQQARLALTHLSEREAWLRLTVEKLELFDNLVLIFPTLNGHVYGKVRENRKDHFRIIFNLTTPDLHQLIASLGAPPHEPIDLNPST